MATTAPEATQTDLAAENQRLRAGLAQALEREHATAAVLASIRADPGNLPRTLAVVAEQAARVCQVDNAVMDLVEGDELVRVAVYGTLDALEAGTRRPLATSAAAPWFAERRTQHIHDTHAWRAERGIPDTVVPERFRGKVRTTLQVPLLRGDTAIGRITLRRAEVHPFSDEQIAALENFAAQAALAIEQARLVRELDEKSRTLAEGLEREQATADILRVIAASPTDAQQVLDAIATRAVLVSGAYRAHVWLVDAAEHAGSDRPRLRLAASRGSTADPTAREAGDIGPLPVGETRPLARDTVMGRCVLAAAPLLVPDLQAVPEDDLPHTHARRAGNRTMLAVPLLRAGAAIGCISAVWTEVRTVEDRETAQLQTFADQAVIAIGNARLFSELQQTNHTLTETLEQQTATADVLRAIAASPNDLPHVLQTIAASVARLCDAEIVVVCEVHGDAYAQTAAWVAESGARHTPGGPLTPLALPTLTGAAIRERRTVHAPDLLGPDGDAFPASRERALHTVPREALGWTPEQGVTSAAAPLLHRGEAVGAIRVMRRPARALSGTELRVLETFADQAVIALENARLFSELNESNRTLREALAQQTATSEILRIISTSPADLQAVLDTIARRACELCGADDAAIARVEDGLIGPVAHYGSHPYPHPRTDAAWRGFPVTRGHTQGIAILDRRTVHIPDLDAVPVEDLAEVGSRRLRMRAKLSAPMLRDGGAIGAITVSRNEPGPFSEQQVRLLETLADQSVIAIENARLFQELSDTNATLKEALEQQTATADVLRIISGSPGDLARVMDAIGASVARLCGADDVMLFAVEGGGLRHVAHHGTLPEFVGPATDRPRPWSSTTILGRAVLERRTVHVPDLGEPGVLEEFPGARPLYERAGVRTSLAVPMLRAGEAVGAISIRLTDVRPFSDQQLALLESFADQAAIAVENTRLFTELRDRDERRRHELERASVIQQRLLPERVEGWSGVLDVAVRFRPAVETSGDFYDVLPLPATRKGDLEPLQIAVGDVAGKGMAAALVTALARSALHTTAAVPSVMATPATALRLAGQRLHRDVGSGHFVACALAVVEPPGLHNAGPFLRLSNAAQVPVLLVRDGEARELEPPGYRLPLGAQPDGRYEDAVIELRRGDAVVFSSDGLVEAPTTATAAVPSHLPPPDKPGELFGFERLSASAVHWSRSASTAEAVAEGIWSDLTCWCGQESHHDDMTLLILRVPA